MSRTDMSGTRWNRAVFWFADRVADRVVTKAYHWFINRLMWFWRIQHFGDAWASRHKMAVGRWRVRRRRLAYPAAAAADDALDDPETWGEIDEAAETAKDDRWLDDQRKAAANASWQYPDGAHGTEPRGSV